MRCSPLAHMQIADYHEQRSSIGARAVPMTPHTPGHMEGADDVQGVSHQGLPACTPATSVLEFDAALESAACEYTCTKPGAGT